MLTLADVRISVPIWVCLVRQELIRQIFKDYGFLELWDVFSQKNLLKDSIYIAHH